MNCAFCDKSNKFSAIINDLKTKLLSYGRRLDSTPEGWYAAPKVARVIA